MGRACCDFCASVLNFLPERGKGTEGSSVLGVVGMFSTSSCMSDGEGCACSGSSAQEVPSRLYE